MTLRRTTMRGSYYLPDQVNEVEPGKIDRRENGVQLATQPLDES